MKFDLYENENFITRLTAVNDEDAIKQIRSCGIRKQSNIIKLKKYGG